MPPKKPKKKTAITLRFDSSELAPLEADRREISNGGVPSKIGAYVKHAAQSYPRLRRLESQLREAASHDPIPMCRAFAATMLGMTL